MAWRLSPVSLSVFSLVPDLSFDCSRLLECAKIRTVLQSSMIGAIVRLMIDDDDDDDDRERLLKAIL